jgi:hypothetical protein
MPRMALTPHWCPLGLTPSQRRRIQWMKAQMLREEAADKERDEHFNTIRSMTPMKQEWRVKEKTSTPALIASKDDMLLLDHNYSLLIKDGSPPLTVMDINMVFTLSAEFRVVEEEITQIGSKLLATAFFVIRVQSNSSVILCYDWIQSNHCVPSILQQFSIQWIDDKIKVVHADALAYITLTDAMTEWQPEEDLIFYDFLSITKDGFVPMSVQLTSKV